jgi:hypothetical protein
VAGITAATSAFSLQTSISITDSQRQAVAAVLSLCPVKGRCDGIDGAGIGGSRVLTVASLRWGKKRAAFANLCVGVETREAVTSRYQAENFPREAFRLFETCPNRESNTAGQGKEK